MSKKHQSGQSLKHTRKTKPTGLTKPISALKCTHTMKPKHPQATQATQWNLKQQQVANKTNKAKSPSNRLV
jgi:hypothetical protein